MSLNVFNLLLSLTLIQGVYIPMEDVVNNINNEINKIEYKEDGEKDYWATPKEMLESGNGDCEDYAISKYFKMKEAGVDPKSMRITHVTLPDGRSHMVLYYNDGKETYVMDNINKEVKRKSDRNDLSIVYSFNEDNLFLSNSSGGERMVGDVSRMSKWSDVLSQMEEDDIIDDYEDGGV